MSWLKFLRMEKEVTNAPYSPSPQKTPKKTPKPDRFIGKIPEDKILEFYWIWENYEEERNKPRTYKARLWLFIHACFPNDECLKQTDADPRDSDAGTRSFFVEVHDDMALEIGVYQKYPGVFLEDEEKNEEPTCPRCGGTKESPAQWGTYKEGGEIVEDDLCAHEFHEEFAG